jgi:hypothetical protein
MKVLSVGGSAVAGLEQQPLQRHLLLPGQQLACQSPELLLC